MYVAKLTESRGYSGTLRDSFSIKIKKRKITHHLFRDALCCGVYHLNQICRG